MLPKEASASDLGLGRCLFCRAKSSAALAAKRIELSSRAATGVTRVVVVFAEGFVEGRRRGCSLSRLQQLQQLYCCYCAASAAAARRPLLLPLAIRGGRRRNAEKAAAEAAAEEDHYCVFLWQSWRYYALALLLLVLLQ